MKFFVLSSTKLIKALLSIIFLAICSTVLFAQENTIKLEKPLEPRGEYTSPSNLGERLKNTFMSKRFKIATHQRDSLYFLNQELTSDTTEQGKFQRALKRTIITLQNSLKNCNQDLNNQKNSFTSLEKRYKALQSASSNELNKLSEQVDEKATQLELLRQELSAREKRLHELEAVIRRQDSTVRAINQAIKDALLQFNSSDLSVEMRNGKVYVSMNDKILFNSGKSQVQEEGIVAIASISDVLNSLNDLEIMVEGHTDNVPIKTPQYSDNWDLSVARATAITRLMIQMGVNPKRITASGKSEFSPKATNLDEAGRSRNRRTEIVLIPNLDEIYKIIQDSSK